MPKLHFQIYESNQAILSTVHDRKLRDEVTTKGDLCSIFSEYEILGFKITDIMFNGSAEDLKQTNITQPSIFLHSVILFKTSEINHVSAVADTLWVNFLH